MGTHEDASFFDKERDRLAGEITAGFEDLLSSSNGLNRKLEEVLGMTKEYDTIAELWHSFYMLMRSQQPEDDEDGPVHPGTGGHVVKARTTPEDN